VSVQGFFFFAVLFSSSVWYLVNFDDGFYAGSIIAPCPYPLNRPSLIVFADD
jgi:hypothetical protein